jgi:hypothetical protein
VIKDKNNIPLRRDRDIKHYFETDGEDRKIRTSGPPIYRLARAVLVLENEWPLEN